MSVEATIEAYLRLPLEENRCLSSAIIMHQ